MHLPLQSLVLASSRCTLFGAQNMVPNNMANLGQWPVKYIWACLGASFKRAKKNFAISQEQSRRFRSFQRYIRCLANNDWLWSFDYWDIWVELVSVQLASHATWTIALFTSTAWSTSSSPVCTHIVSLLQISILSIRAAGFTFDLVMAYECFPGLWLTRTPLRSPGAVLSLCSSCESS